MKSTSDLCITGLQALQQIIEFRVRNGKIATIGYRSPQRDGAVKVVHLSVFQFAECVYETFGDVAIVGIRV